MPTHSRTARFLDRRSLGRHAPECRGRERRGACQHHRDRCARGRLGRQAEIADEVDRLRAEADENPDQQIAIAQQIQNLVAGASEVSDDHLCGALQGNTVLAEVSVTDSLLARAEVLLQETCPGSSGLLTDPPEVPLSGNIVGDDTVYGRLDLSTPENAVVTFGELFTNEAFMLLLFTFDAEAQGVLVRAINNLDPSTVVDSKVLETWDGVESEAHFNTLVGNFASLMTEASRTESHILDLSGPLEIVSTSSLEWSEPRGATVDAQVVEASSQSLGTAYFLMVESPSGRWRVRQVALDPTEFGSSGNDRAVFIAS